MKTDKLFVYGSLMGGIQSPIATYLKSNSTFLGEGTVNGILLDIGKYPGLIAQTDTENRVVGHIFQLNAPLEMMPNLDHYECVGDAFPQPNQYRREIITVALNEEEYPCWVYLYNWRYEDLTIIESGNYLEYFQQNKNYQQFVKSLNDFSRNS